MRRRNIMNFDKWLKENHPDEWRTFELLDEFYIWKSEPLNTLYEECPWIKEKRKLFGVNFSESEIKELLNKGYSIQVDYNINRDKHYQYDFMPFEHSLDVTIYRGERSVIEFYETDTDFLYNKLEPFELFEKHDRMCIYDAD
jgi:hypothetical protein